MLNSSSPDFRLITAAAMLFALLVATSSVHGSLFAANLCSLQIDSVFITKIYYVKAKISIKNQCVTNITACDVDNFRVTCYGLTGGGKSQVEIDVGTSWYGKIWGLPNNLGDGSLGYTALTQANSVDFTIDVELDYYYLSNMFAYNLPLMVKSTSNQTCPSLNCTIDNLRSFCQSPTGEPGLGCSNTDSDSTQATNGTRAFSAACPDAASSEGDPQGVLGLCESGGNYEVVFCP